MPLPVPFPDSIQPDMHYRRCVSACCFNHQIVASRKPSSIKGPWFTFEHTEVGDKASFELTRR